MVLLWCAGRGEMIAADQEGRFISSLPQPVTGRGFGAVLDNAF